MRTYRLMGRDAREERAPHHEDFQLIARIRVLILSACGPSSLASLSRYGSAIAVKLFLSTSVTTLTPSDFSLTAAAFSSSNAFAGSLALISAADVSTHCLCSAERLCHNLSLTNTRALLASCSVIDSTGATS